MQIENRILAALQSQLDTLDDPRRGQGKRHRQGFVLLIVLLATIGMFRTSRHWVYYQGDGR